MTQHKLLIGAHTSAAGGVQNAIYEGASIGATTVQLFTANQRQWNSKPLDDQTVLDFKRALAETGLSSIMSHDSYLINLGSPNPEMLEKSRKAFRQEIERCLKLDLTYMNFHPGAALDSSVEVCLNTIAESLLGVDDLIQAAPKDSKLTLLIETTAGQGSTVGKTFEEIGYLIGRVKGKIPVGVCIDTCHIFAAGYDIRTKEGLDRVLDEFDAKIGLSFLKAFHLNDSMKKCGSRVDRHSDLGKGEIGFECFSHIMKSERLRDLPKYLETPGGPSVWAQEILWLKSQA